MVRADAPDPVVAISPSAITVRGALAALAAAAPDLAASPRVRLALPPA